MNPKILETIANFNEANISEERKSTLQLLVNLIKTKKSLNEAVRLNFICTHNSRRSHLSQTWAQAMAFHFKIKNVYCYSGGTEATAMFPKVVETLVNQGFEIDKLSEGENPVYSIKFDKNESPIIGFSKTFDNKFNPESNFCAIMTCSSADEDCPFIAGAEKRIPIRYDDPKIYDGTPKMDWKYTERSLEIAQEMWWVFANLK